MKVLKYSIITFVVLLFLFLGIGWINPSFTYENVVETSVGRQLAWQVFTSREKMKEWMLDLEAVRVLKDEEGVIGNEYEFHFVQNGEDLFVREVVTEFREAEVYAFDLDSEALTATTRITFESSEMGTRIKSETEVHPKGMILRSLFFMIKDTFREQSDIQYNLLKQTIEASHP